MLAIGLPVFNGERFLDEALWSLRRQTFSDFQLFISDNGSTDSTESICRRHAENDRRLVYVRQPENRGAAANYETVFQMARQDVTYFKWTAHDDVYQPAFLEQCIRVLDADPDCVLCFARTKTINQSGEVMHKWKPQELHAPGMPPHERFRSFLEPFEDHVMWGVIRASALRKSGRLGNYVAHDFPFLAELSLHGRVRQVPEYLFLHREHPGRSVRAFDYRNPHGSIAWFDPQQAGRLVFPAWRLAKEFTAAIRRSPLSGRERFLCYREMARYAVRHRFELVHDLVVAASGLPQFGTWIVRGEAALHRRRWERRRKRLLALLRANLAPDAPIVMIDDNALALEAFQSARIYRVFERDGIYWGAPEDDGAAVEEIGRLRSLGARYVVMAWPAFWWRSHYDAFFSHLQTQFACVHDDEVACVFDMVAMSDDAPSGF